MKSLRKLKCCKAPHIVAQILAFAIRINSGEVLGEELSQLASFWDGTRLSALEAACLESFTRLGFKVTLFAYRAVENVPLSVVVADAAQIVDDNLLKRFRVMGRPSAPHFADYFRCCLFKRTEFAWIDTDIICLKQFSIHPGERFLAKENDQLLGNAVLRIPSDDPLMPKLISSIEKLASGAHHAYGTSGPALLTKMCGQESIANAFPQKYFYPIASNRWWAPFLPSERMECEHACAEANVLHLWNNLITGSGVWKDLLPPEGSFLHDRLVALGLAGQFNGTYPESVFITIANNYDNLQTASHIPATQLFKIAARRGLHYIERMVSKTLGK